MSEFDADYKNIDQRLDMLMKLANSTAKGGFLERMAKKSGKDYDVSWLEEANEYINKAINAMEEFLYSGNAFSSDE